MDKQLEAVMKDSELGLEESERKAMYFDRHEGKKLVQLAQRMVEVKKLADWLEQVGKYVNAEYDILRIAKIPEAMEKEGLESPVNVAGVGRVSLTADVYVSIGNAEPVDGVDYKGALYDWLHKHKMGDLITESINSSTLKAWVKGRIKEGKPYPSDCLKVTPFTRASIISSR